MNIETLSTDELRALLDQVAQLIQVRRAQEVADQQSRQERITDAITDLTGLLGEEDAAPSLESIRGVQAHTDQDIAAHPVLAIRLILAGMEVLTDTMLDVAKVVGE